MIASLKDKLKVLTRAAQLDFVVITEAAIWLHRLEALEAGGQVEGGVDLRSSLCRGVLLVADASREDLLRLEASVGAVLGHQSGEQLIVGLPARVSAQPGCPAAVGVWR